MSSVTRWGSLWQRLLPVMLEIEARLVTYQVNALPLKYSSALVCHILNFLLSELLKVILRSLTFLSLGHPGIALHWSSLLNALPFPSSFLPDPGVITSKLSE